MNFSETAAAAYTDLIKEQLLEERSRKTSFEQRSMSVITSSGTMVALLFALVAIVTKSTTFIAPKSALVLVPIPLACFGLAALTVLLSNFPFPYVEVDEDNLMDRLKKGMWRLPVEDAAEQAAEVRVNILKTARRLNDWKGRLLIAAMALEVAGIVVVAWIVFEILLSA